MVEMSDAEKVKASLAKIEKQFGAGAIMRLSDAPKVKVEVIPCGIMSIDLATGISGFPRGRIVEISGPESSGKTLLALYVVAEAQRQGLEVAFIDAEHALNVELAPKIGVDIGRLLISQPDGGEQALEIVEELCKGGGMGLIVVDSVAGLVPRAEVEGEMGDSHMGLQARLMSQAMRKIAGPANKHGTTVLFINQLRTKVNIGPYGGNPETTPGGRALPFWASMRLDVRSIGQIKDGESVVGRKTRIKIVKNKLAAPFRQAEVDLLFADNDAVGFDKLGDIIDLGVKCGLLSKKGGWIKSDTWNAHGVADAKRHLTENPNILEELKNDILLCVGKIDKIHIDNEVIEGIEGEE